MIGVAALTHRVEIAVPPDARQLGNSVLLPVLGYPEADKGMVGLQRWAARSSTSFNVSVSSGEGTAVRCGRLR